MNTGLPELQPAPAAAAAPTAGSTLGAQTAHHRSTLAIMSDKINLDVRENFEAGGAFGEATTCQRLHTRAVLPALRAGRLGSSRDHLRSNARGGSEAAVLAMRSLLHQPQLPDRLPPRPALPCRSPLATFP